jgi:protein-tyrosine kinase
MSKYFDTTLKARSTVVSEDILKTASEPEAPKEKPVVVRKPASQQFDTTRKISIPLAKLPHVQFVNSNSVEPAEESYRALRTRVLRLGASQKLGSVVVTSAMQGEGKTLTSLNMALCCAQLHEMRVLLIDADIRSCGLSRALDIASKPGLADVLFGKCKPEEAVLATDRPNLYVLGSGAHTMPAAELFASGRWQEFVGWCNENFKLVIVDSPPVLNLSDVELITAGCDGVIMVVRAHKTKRQILQKCAGQIDSKKLIGVVYNGTETNTRYGYGHKYGANREE